jgi:4-amino-4-deoxy-L-arabinose transferase-like glycosyltransferase
MRTTLIRLASVGPRGRIEGEGRARESGRVRPYLLIVLLCLVLYAPGLAAIPPLDRDEARFAQASRQMLETGDFIRIRFQDEARNKKPIGIYWLQAASVAAFSTPESTAIWPYRLPSALAATAAALLTFAVGVRLLSSRSAGLIAAVLLASALGVVAEAHLAKTDAALLAAVTAGQGALGCIYAATRCGRRVSLALTHGFWLAEAVALLLKGPAGPIFALLTMAALSIVDRDIRWVNQLRPVTGLMLTALVVAPWFIAVESATGWHFISDSLSHDLLPKLVGAQESHGAPPGYYLALAVTGFWPGSLLIIPAMLWSWRQRDAAAERFLLCWLFPAWVLFELVPTKLPHYVLPLYPALALLAGSVVVKGLGARLLGGLRYLDTGVRLLWTTVTIALAAALIALPLQFGGAVSPAAIVAIPVMLALAVLLLVWRWQSAHVAGIVAALAAAFVLPAAFVVAPGLDDLWLSRAAAAALARHPSLPGEVVLSVGYSEPSIAFLLGTNTRLITATPTADQLAGAGIALVNNHDDAQFRQSLAGVGLTARPLDRVTGLDYSAGGARVTLILYRLERV